MTTDIATTPSSASSTAVADSLADTVTAPPERRRRGHRADSGNGSPHRPRLERIGLAVLLTGTAVLYLWGLDKSGWANSFYSAAAQAGSQSWKAFFFGSSDAANSITVDKTPLALWPMALSVRLFGLSSWSLLVPQALFGVASVALLTVTVRRITHSAAAGLVAGAVLALTPVAVLMFRFNNPDALLTLLLIGAAYATVRAIEPDARALRWLMIAGALVGLAFLAKMLQAFLVLPGLVVAYAIFAHGPWRRRVGHLVAAFLAMVVAGGWWIAIVELWPASSRPYIGGSQHNSILELALGYNGFGRLTGDETGSVGGSGGWGETGLLRLLDSDNGGQIGWLLPAAVLLGAGSLWLARRDRTLLAGLTVWLGWLLVTGLTFSLMAGIFHPYYSVALAPAIAATLGIGGFVAWRERQRPIARALLSSTIAVAAITAFVLLARSADWLPWLRYGVLGVGLIVAIGLVRVDLLSTRARGVVAAAALITALAGPTAYSLQTASTGHTGSLPSAGPTVSQSFGRGGGPGGGPGGGAGGMPGNTAGSPPGGTGTGGGTAGQPSTGSAQANGAPTNRASTGQGGAGGPGAGGDGGGGPSGAGGLLDTSTPGSELTALLSADASSYTWVAAAVGSQTAAGYQLATEAPVMAIGGFNGSDPSPTLAEFQAYVAAGKIHYFIAGSGFGGQMGGSNNSSQIASWVEENFTAQTVDGVTVYDLTADSAGSAS
ncbi:MAG: glycosyltransferase family 39 protein [Nocardioides sp.]|uniref:ArnT family glycosyltransferase n=1 Tax=Nocardioides sp. TaxID=35761 RepID=UPI0039E55713